MEAEPNLPDAYKKKGVDSIRRFRENVNLGVSFQIYNYVKTKDIS